MVALTAPQLRVAEHHEHFGAEHGDAVFEAGNDLGRGDVAGDAHDEELADVLVEDELHRHPRVGAREHRRERLLLLGGLGLQDRQVFVERLQLAAEIALVAVHQRLQRRVGGQRALRHRRLRGHNGRARQHRGRADDGAAQEAAASGIDLPAAVLRFTHAIAAAAGRASSLSGNIPGIHRELPPVRRIANGDMRRAPTPRVSSTVLTSWLVDRQDLDAFFELERRAGTCRSQDLSRRAIKDEILVIYYSPRVSLSRLTLPSEVACRNRPGTAAAAR